VEYDPTGWHRSPGGLPPGFQTVEPFPGLRPSVPPRHRVPAPPLPVPTPIVEVAEIQAVAAIAPEVVHDRTGIEHDRLSDHTVADIDGGLSLVGRWLLRFWLRITVTQRR
jgi:hypothetical protein